MAHEPSAMYLLVNLEGHLPVMGEIISGLVSKYSVPISIVDTVEKLCPNCSAQPNATKMVDGQVGGGGSQFQMPQEPAEPIDVKPTLMEHTNGSPNMGRRTAAKHSAIMRALEKKPEELKHMAEADILDLLDGNAQSTSAVPSGSSRSDSHTPTMDAVTSSGMHTPGDESTAEMDDTAPMLDHAGDFTNQDFESMHPTLLACLISNTPNVFAQDCRTSPLSDIASPSDGGLDNSGLLGSTNRVLGHLITSSGKMRRGRIVYNSRDLDVLETFYKQDPNACADPMKKKQMMDILGVDAIRLKVWFQNRRRKDKIKWMKDNNC